jgi:hypothetical protein
MLAPPSYRPPPTPRRRVFILAIQLSLVTVAVLALPVAAVPRYRTSAPALSGELRVVGSRLLDGPVARWVAIFHREHPAVRVQVTLAGSGAAADAMEQGRADVASLLRTLMPDEQARFPSGAAPRGIPLGPGRRYRVATGDAAGEAPIYLYLNHPARRPASATALELARIATSAEGAGRVRVSLFEALTHRADISITD